MQIPKSPKLYETKKEITKLDPDLDFDLDLKDAPGFIDVIKFNNETPENEENYMILSIPKIDNVNYGKYVSFLCELEMFEWKEYFHRAHTKYITMNMFNRLFVSYLCKTIGNDITLYSDIFTENFEPMETIIDNVITKIPVYTTYTLESEQITQNLIKEKFKGKLFMNTSEPIYIKEILNGDKYLYNFFYSESIFDSNTRYVLVTVTLAYTDSSHYCFLFVDHKKKLVEFYDPYASNSKKETLEFIYSSLILLFPDYDVEEYWKTKGIQVIEELEPSNEEGFCVIWGNMMIHLKLLNMNIPIVELEKLFIEECYDKKLSLYEVMLNYAYFMTRVVPRKEYKFIELENVLI